MSTENRVEETPSAPTQGASRASAYLQRGWVTIAPAAPLLRIALWAAAFGFGYAAQMRLEDQAGGFRALWYIIIGVALLAFATVPWPNAPFEARGEPRVAVRSFNLTLPVALLGLGLAVGFFFRVYELNSQPDAIWYDEALNGLIARDILHGVNPPLFIGGFTQLPSGFFYIYAAFSKVLGEGILTLRIVTTIGGLLALPFLFLLAREYLGARVAALATFILAVMRWHVNFSRFAVTNIWAAGLALAAAYFFVRGIRGRSRWNLVVAGLFLGAVPYTGFYGLFAPIVIVLLWAHTAIFDRVLSWRAHGLTIVIVALTALAVYSPVVIWGLRHPDRYTSRPDEVLVTKGLSLDEAYHAVVKSAKQHVFMFNSVGDTNGRHNIPAEPMLDTLTGLLFLLGLGYALLKLRRPGYFLFVIWILVFIENGIWSTGAPQAFRTSAVTPAVAVFAALPLAALWEIASRSWPSDGESAHWRIRGISAQSGVVSVGAAVLIAVLLGGIAWKNYDTFFNHQVNSYPVYSEYQGSITAAGYGLQANGKDHDLYLTPLLASPVIELMYPPPDQDAPNVCHWEGCVAPVSKGYTYLDSTRDLPLTSKRDAAIYLHPTEQSLIPWLQFLYPNASVREIAASGTPHHTAVWEVLVPASDIAEHTGIDARYSKPGAAPITQREDGIPRDWQDASKLPLAPPFDAQWSGVMKSTIYGSRTLTVTAPGTISLTLDGVVVAMGENSVDATVPMFRGDHQFRLDVQVRSAGQVAFLIDRAPVAASLLFRADPSGEAHGLLASYYHGYDWSGESYFQQLDPFVGHTYHGEIAVPYSAIWHGEIDAPTTGAYVFQLDANNEASLMIDGQPVVNLPGTAPGTVQLTQGRHDIELRFRNRSGYDHIYLRWQPPGQALDVVPSERLFAP